MLAIGSVVDGKYKILNEIGRGGMSTVYLAVNERANKPWAIKEVRKEGVENFEIVKQSQIIETNLLKKLKHPNLPSIIDVIDQNDSILIVMDYIEGKPLSETLAEKKCLPCEEVIEWAKQLCDVLGYLHTRNPPVIYRDMKPSNIMLKPDGTVVLIDFGTAREFKEKSMDDTVCLGTQGYAAPEQFGGQGQTDTRTDIYCLGATIYHLVTGHNPSEPPYEMYPIRYWNPSLSTGLEKIILKCTQKNPENRYQSCGELLYVLEHYKEEEEEYQKEQKKKWNLFTGVMVLTGIMAIAATVSYLLMNTETNKTYEKYLSIASMALDTAEKYGYYEKAIEILPMKSDAYNAVLETMQSDGVFSEAESQEVRKIMPQYMGSLSKNKEAYMNIAYELGIMYFYYYENSEDVQNAEKWLNIALGNTMDGIKEADVDAILGVKKAFRARRLYGILQYYRNLNIINKEGDCEGSYLQLWEDLQAIIEPDIAKEDNNVTALVMYNFMANQLALHAQNYMKDGVPEKDMQKMVNLIKSSAVNNKDNEYEEALYDKLQRNLEQAKKAISLVEKEDY